MKRKIIIFAIFLIIGILGLVGFKLFQTPKGTQEITKSFLDNLSKGKIPKCEKILNEGIDPNCKDSNG
ncbi:hypothetical protein EXQ42_16290 [Clostridium botulinum]|nr:hypothetical protein [Clostridium botulinum]MBO0576286.1 hypothetical protein [Clostridium botulinum]